MTSVYCWNSLVVSAKLKSCINAPSFWVCSRWLMAGKQAYGYWFGLLMAAPKVHSAAFCPGRNVKNLALGKVRSFVLSGGDGDRKARSSHVSQWHFQDGNVNRMVYQRVRCREKSCLRAGI